MLDTNHQNSSCAFAEQLVSYLYNEANEQEKSGFKAHLATCENCADELSAFVFVRSSVQQWRTEDFLSLPTPAMKIPFEKSPETSVHPTEKRSWLTDLQQLLTFSPARTAVAAMAVLVVGVVLTLFAYNFSGKPEVAENNPVKPIKPAALPTLEQPSKIASEEIARKHQTDQLNVAPEFINSVPKIENSPGTNRKNSVEKISNSTKRLAKDELVAQNSDDSAPVRKLKDIDKINKTSVAKNQKVPKLTDFDEVKDDSLRLADLMAEVENK